MCIGFKVPIEPHWPAPYPEPLSNPEAYNRQQQQQQQQGVARDGSRGGRGRERVTAIWTQLISAGSVRMGCHL